MDNSTPGMSEKLVKYLDGELAGNEKEELERQLATDARLQEELENLKLAREAIHHYGLKNQVSNIHAQMMQELQSPVRSISSTRRIIRYSMSIAAGILILFLGITTYNYFNPSASQLFNENYQPYDLATPRDATSSALSSVENAYRDGNYPKVIALAEKNDSLSVKEIFLLGMSYMETRDDAKAVTSFNKVIAANKSAGTTILQDQAEYYLSLAYLRSKDYDHALALMNKIHDDTGDLYHVRVSASLISKIKRLK